MTRINIERQEKLCRLVFSGKLSHVDAFLEAGYCQNANRASAIRGVKRVLRNPAVVARLAELKQKAENALIMDVTERKIRLSEIARANLTDFVDEKGNITLKASGSLAEVVLEEWKNEDKEGTVTSREKRIKLRDPVPAIQELNKMDGIGKGDAPAVSVTVNATQNNNTLRMELDGDTLNAVTRVLGEVGALRMAASQELDHPDDEIHSTQTNAEAVGVPVPGQP